MADPATIDRLVRFLDESQARERETSFLLGQAQGDLLLATQRTEAAEKRADDAERERDRVKADLAAQRAASLDARVLAVIEAAREVDKFGPDPHVALRNLEDALRALEGVDLTAQPDDLARKACEACIGVHLYGSAALKECLEIGSALAARRAKGGAS